MSPTVYVFFGAILLVSATLARHRLIVLCMCLATVTSAVQAGSREASKTLRNFDLGALQNDRLEPAATGTKADDLLSAFLPLDKLIKGETETSEEFERRSMALVKGRLPVNTSLERPFAFVVNVRADSPLQYTYDADSKSLRLTYVDEDAYLSNGLKTITTHRRRVGAGSYVAKTALGVSTQVSRSTVYSTGFALWGGPLAEGDSLANVEMEPAVAARELRSLKALVVLTFPSPKIVKEDYEHEPRLDEPFHRFDKLRYAFGELQGVVFFSGLTGKIIGRSPANFGLARSDADPAEAPEK